jgi:hypothetical protein
MLWRSRIGAALAVAATLLAAGDVFTFHALLGGGGPPPDPRPDGRCAAGGGGRGLRPPAVPDPGALPITTSWHVTMEGNPWAGVAAAALARPPGAPAGPAVGPYPRLAVVYDERFVGSFLQAQLLHVVELLGAAYGWTRHPVALDAAWPAVRAGLLAAHGGAAPALVLFLLGDVWSDEWANNLAEAAAAARGAEFEATRFWLYVDDAHVHAPDSAAQARARLAGRRRVLAAVDGVVATVGYALLAFHPDLDARKVFWFYNAATPEFALPFNPDPAPAVFAGGATSPRFYPVRSAIAARAAAGDGRLVWGGHPGSYSNSHVIDGRSMAQADFAAAMHGHLACATDGNALNYTLAKLLEIPATGCLLLAHADVAGLLTWLQFIEGVHFLTYTLDTFDAVVDAVLAPASRTFVDEIRRNGQALTQSRHMLSHRVSALHDAALAAVGAVNPTVTYTVPVPGVPDLAAWFHWLQTGRVDGAT